MKNIFFSRQNYCYLMKNDRKWIKIGYAFNPPLRLKALRTSDPSIELLHVIATDDMYRLESMLHEKYAKYKVIREWYILPDKALERLLVRKTIYTNKRLHV